MEADKKRWKEKMNISGIWKVKVTGPWWFKAFNWLRDEKVIKGNAGHNVSYGKKWGKFDIFSDQIQFILKYKNGRIKDVVWFAPFNENKLLGKFYWNGRFIGNFEMTRV